MGPNKRKPDSDLSGKALLVCGSSELLSEALAEAAKRQGARIALAAPGATSKYPAGRASGIHGFPPDGLNDAGDFDLLIEQADKRLSGLNAVIATIASPPIHDLNAMSMEDWEFSATAPLKRAIWLARRVVWEFLATGKGGRLTFVTEPAPAGTPSNEIVGSGLVSLARSIAKEVGRRGISCTVVLSDSDESSLQAPFLPIVNSALFLVSDAASFINGEAVTVRG